MESKLLIPNPTLSNSIICIHHYSKLENGEVEFFFSRFGVLTFSEFGARFFSNVRPIHRLQLRFSGGAYRLHGEASRWGTWGLSHPNPNFCSRQVSVFSPPPIFFVFFVDIAHQLWFPLLICSEEAAREALCIATRMLPVASLLGLLPIRSPRFPVSLFPLSSILFSTF